jgi:hypothetical protein
MDKLDVIQKDHIAITAKASRIHLRRFCSRRKSSPFVMLRIALHAFCQYFKNQNKPKSFTFALAGPARRASSVVAFIIAFKTGKQRQ